MSQDNSKKLINAEGLFKVASGIKDYVDGKNDNLRADVISVFNSLDLKYEENKISLVLPADQSGVETPLGEIELPILTADEADALIIELGLGE